MASPGAAGNVLIVGHPYVDVWQAIRPAVLGIEKWPVIPRGVDWKTGILMAFGWPHSTKEDIGLGWQKLLGAVRSYADLEPLPAGQGGGGHRLPHRALRWLTGRFGCLAILIRRRSKYSWIRRLRSRRSPGTSRHQRSTAIRRTTPWQMTHANTLATRPAMASPRTMAFPQMHCR